MKLTKSIICSILVMLTVASAAVFSSSAVTVQAITKVMTQYTRVVYPDSKSSEDTYKIKIKNNDKNYIKVKYSDSGSTYRLTVTAKKVTPEEGKPLLTVYKEKNGKKIDVKKYRFTVNKPSAKTYNEMKINVNMTKKKTIKNPYYKEYTIKYDKKIAKIKKSVSGEKYTYKVKALKKGSTTVEVYLKDTKVKVGSFKVTAGDYPTTISKKYKPLELKYNSHGTSSYMEDCHISLSKMLKDKKSGATYSVVIENEKIASSFTEKKNTIIYSVGTGSTQATVYQKIGKKEETEIGKFTINVTKAKMSYVAKQNMLLFTEGIFGNGEMVEFLSPSESFTMKSTIVKSLVNNTYTGSSFKKSQYSISYKSTDKSVVTVSKEGKVTGKKPGYAVVNYTITFSDKSTFEGGCPIEVLSNSTEA